MDFNVFVHGRDLLYLSGIFSGLAAGFLASYFRKDISRRSRSRRIAFSLLFFSGTIAALALAVIVSSGAIFRDTAVIVAALICIPVFVLTVLFPRAAAYPLVLAGGLAAVCLGYTFLRFPLVQTTSGGEEAAGLFPVASITTVSETHYMITFFQPAANKTETAPLQITGAMANLHFSAAFISFEPFFPLVGGTARGMITKISRDDETIYENTAIQSALAFNLQNISLTIPSESIPQDMKLDILYSGSSLSISAR